MVYAVSTNTFEIEALSVSPARLSEFYVHQRNDILPPMRFSLGLLFAAIAFIALVTGAIVAANSALTSLCRQAIAPIPQPIRCHSLESCVI